MVDPGGPGAVSAGRMAHDPDHCRGCLPSSRLTAPSTVAVPQSYFKFELQRSGDFLPALTVS